jgi:hypothetical protein
MKRLLLATLVLLMASSISADGILPPRPELLGIKNVYLDIRVLVGEHGEPGLLETPEIAERLRAPVVSVLAEAGIGTSEKKPALLPQFRLCAQVIRNRRNPGVVSVGVEVSFSDVVKVTRLPKVVPTYQGSLWSSSTVDLIPEGELDTYLATEVTRATHSFVDDIRYAKTGKPTDELE